MSETPSTIDPAIFVKDMREATAELAYAARLLQSEEVERWCAEIVRLVGVRTDNGMLGRAYKAAARTRDMLKVEAPISVETSDRLWRQWESMAEGIEQGQAWPLRMVERALAGNESAVDPELPAL